MELHNAKLFRNRSMCKREGRMCSKGGDLFVEHHADWQLPAPRGQDGFGSEYGGYTKSTRSTALILDADILDERPANWSSLLWYFQISLRVTRCTKHALAVFKTHQLVSPCARQSCAFGTILLRAPCSIFYSGQLSFKGRLLDSVYHAHGHFQEALLFAASPKKLGLDGALSSGTGHVEGGRVAFDSIRKAHSELLICEALPCSEVVNGLSFPRAPRIQCSSWSFNVNDTWVADRLRHLLSASTTFGFSPVFQAMGFHTTRVRVVGFTCRKVSKRIWCGRGDVCDRAHAPEVDQLRRCVIDNGIPDYTTAIH